MCFFTGGGVELIYYKITFNQQPLENQEKAKSREGLEAELNELLALISQKNQEIEGLFKNRTEISNRSKNYGQNMNARNVEIEKAYAERTRYEKELAQIENELAKAE